jgi:hypothetical protein
MQLQSQATRFQGRPAGIDQIGHDVAIDFPLATRIASFQSPIPHFPCFCVRVPSNWLLGPLPATESHTDRFLHIREFLVVAQTRARGAHYASLP